MSDLTLADLCDPADYQTAVAAGLILRSVDGAGLTIHNYSDAAMFTPGAWDNPAVRACRGVITRDDGTIAARPWAKFFNHGQKEAGDLDLTAPVEVTDKMDGSLGIIHRTVDGRLRVATRGSFESDQAIHATAVLLARYADSIDATGSDDYTPLVEIVYPNNRIVCDYGDTDDLMLLGAVHIDTGAYLGPDEASEWVGWTGPRTQTFDYATLTDALAAPPRPGAEGMCVRYLNESRIVKIKQEAYVALHKIVTGLSERSVWEHMSAGLPIEHMLRDLPDELHDWTRDVWARLDGEAANLYAQAAHTHRAILANLPLDWTRGDYAAAAKQHGPLTPWLFSLLDGRDPHDRILYTLKPAGVTARPRTYSEATA